MKLSDRGVCYQDDLIAIEMSEETQVTGKCRSQDCQLWRYPRHMPVPQGSGDLKCRGIAHSTYQTAEPEFAALKVQAVVNQADTVMSTSSSRRSVKEEVAQVHRANILQNLEHRLQVARSRGDQELIRQLEKEMEQLS